MLYLYLSLRPATHRSATAAPWCCVDRTAAKTPAPAPAPCRPAWRTPPCSERSTANINHSHINYFLPCLMQKILDILDIRYFVLHLVVQVPCFGGVWHVTRVQQQAEHTRLVRTRGYGLVVARGQARQQPLHVLQLGEVHGHVYTNIRKCQQIPILEGEL